MALNFLSHTLMIQLRPIVIERRRFWLMLKTRLWPSFAPINSVMFHSRKTIDKDQPSENVSRECAFVGLIARLLDDLTHPKVINACMENVRYRALQRNVQRNVLGIRRNEGVFFGTGTKARPNKPVTWALCYLTRPIHDHTCIAGIHNLSRHVACEREVCISVTVSGS